MYKLVCQLALPLLLLHVKITFYKLCHSNLSITINIKLVKYFLCSHTGTQARKQTPMLKNTHLYCHTRLHLGFSAKLRILQVSPCKMEPRSGIISCKIPTRPPTHPPIHPPTRQVSFGSLDSLLFQIGY